MIKDTSKGTTHYYGDGCKEHTIYDDPNYMKTNNNKIDIDMVVALLIAIVIFGSMLSAIYMALKDASRQDKIIKDVKTSIFSDCLKKSNLDVELCKSIIIIR